MLDYRKIYKVLGFRYIVMLIAFSCFSIFNQSLNLKAQDPHISQYFANQLYMSPAFAGSNFCPQVKLQYRKQWPNISGGFSTTMLSYDQYIHAIRGGLGIYVLADVQGGGSYRNIEANLSYAYNFKLGEHFNIKLGVSAAYVNRYANWHSLTFPDQFDPIYGLVRPKTDEELIITPVNRHYADFGAGFVGYNDYFYFGFAAKHFSRPDESFMSVRRLDIKYTAYAGGKIYFRNTYQQKKQNGDIFLSPNIIFTSQGKFEELSYGLYLNVYPIIIGSWYRHSFSNPDAVVALLGFEYGMWRLAYSYDITVSTLKHSGGSHEITLGIKLPCFKLKHRFKLDQMPCPIF